MSPDIQRETLAQVKRALSSGPRCVLLVEDDEADATMATNILKAAGVNVVWVKTRTEALEAFTTCSMRLVLLDLKLQHVSGIELITAFKEIRPDCWVIVFSGAFAEDAPECKEALRLGAQAVMIKPLTPEKVELIFGTP